jgi:ABC-type histidine transport system ATPase subunit
MADPATATTDPNAGDGTHAVEVNALEKSFGALKVLQGVSLHAPEGSAVSMIGASGSGKSTFLRCLNLLEMPDKGELSIAGESIRFRRDALGRTVGTDRRQIQRLRSKVTMVFQQFNLWPHMTVLGNVIEAPVQVKGMPKAEAREIGEAFLERVGMSDKRDEYPAFLSGGQQQRTAIARALAMQPRVLLFDEPTSALDPELVGEVLNVIRSLVEEGRTMVLVTHEMSFARDVSSEVVFLDQGVVAERGDPAKVFERPDSERCRQFVSAVA